jgi:integrase
MVPTRRWIAEVTIGHRSNGKRIVRKASGRTKTAAKNKLKELLRDHEDGLTIAPHEYTVAQALTDWLANYERTGHDTNTVRTVRGLVDNHIIPALGARVLRELSADDVDAWLADKTATFVTTTLRHLHSILRRAITRAQSRDEVKRNVVLLCECPVSQGTGRPSKALTLTQAEAILKAAENSLMRGYIVTALLTGARTEELRALTWAHVDLTGNPNSNHRTSKSGGRCAQEVRLRPASRDAP